VVEEIGIDRARAAVAAADLLLWLGDDAPPQPDAIWLQPRADEPGRETAGSHRIAVSARTGQGVEYLWQVLASRAADLLPPPDLLALNLRQRELAAGAAAALEAAALEDDLLLLAEHLRSARRSFDAITGRADVEAVLDALFARFCIGK
jgi:tRNA modification GTPase